MKEQEEKIMSENLNIDVAAMLNQFPPEMQKQMQAQMQTFINIMMQLFRRQDHLQ